MNDYPRWKHLLVALVTVLGILYAVPSLFQKQPAVQVIANKGALIDEALKESALQAMQERKISFGGVEIKDERLLVGFPNTDSQLAAASALRTDLGDKYTVALNLASTVPQWMRMNQRQLDAAGPRLAGRCALPHAGGPEERTGCPGAALRGRHPFTDPRS